MIMELVQLGSHENCVEAGRFYVGCDLLYGRCGVVAEVMVTEVIAKLEEKRSVRLLAHRKHSGRLT